MVVMAIRQGFEEKKKKRKQQTLWAQNKTKSVVGPCSAISGSHLSETICVCLYMYNSSMIKEKRMSE